MFVSHYWIGIILAVSEGRVCTVERWDSSRLKSRPNYQVYDIFIGTSLAVKNSATVNDNLRVFSFGVGPAVQLL